MVKALKRLILGFGLLVCLGSALATDKTNPSWTDLTRAQQTALAPLQGEWNNFDQPRKRKWLGVAARFPQMSAEEKARIQRRMQAWANLSPEERQVARDSYRDLSKLPEGQRQIVRQKWDEYRKLPEDERKQWSGSPVQRRN